MLTDDHIIELAGAEGLLLYGDSAVPEQFYYAATRPRIARDADGHRFTLVRYDRPRDGQAGMLSFVVDLAPDPAELATALRTLRRRTPGAQLSPVPSLSGTVTAAIIGGDPVHTVPSLLNDNSAVVCLGLTTEQYLLLKHSLDDPLSVPISVVYDLRFEALRPAYSFSIRFDEERSRDWLQKKKKAGLLFFSVEKIETFEELRHSGAIEIIFIDEREEEPPTALKRAFLQSLKALLTPLPAFTRPTGDDDGGWEIGYSSSTLHEIQTYTRKLDLNMTMRAAVARSIHVQGALTDLADALSSRPVVELPTSGSFLQDVTIRCHGPFDGDPLEALSLSVTPAAIQPSARVFGARGGGEWRVSLPHNPYRPVEYSCSCDLDFVGEGRASATGAAAIRRDQAFVDILPSAFYTFRRYHVTVADDFPWRLIRSVTVRLCGIDGIDGIDVSPATLILNGARPSGTMELFAPAPVDLDEVWFEAVHKAVNGMLHTEGGFPSGTAIFLNPLRQRRVTFAASPSVDWGRCRTIAVTPRGGRAFQIWDPSQKIALTAAAPRAAFTYWFTDDGTLSCRTTLVLTAGGTAPGPTIAGAGPRIAVSDRNELPEEET